MMTYRYGLRFTVYALNHIIPGQSFKRQPVIVVVLLDTEPERFYIIYFH